jgi:hypothetical protein
MQGPLSITALINHATTALIAGAIGGILGAGVRWGEQRADRGRRRRAVSTALLHDLRVVELNVRLLAESDDAARVVNLPGGTFGQQIRKIGESDNLFLLRPETVSRLLYLATLLGKIDEIGALFPKAAVGSRPLLHSAVRSHAWFAANLVPLAKRALQQEGGTLPPIEPPDSLTGFEIPALGEPAFPEWSVPAQTASPPMWVDEHGRPRPESAE